MTKTKSKILTALLLVLILISSCCLATESEDALLTSSDTNVTTSETETETETNTDSTVSWTYSDLFITDDNVEVSNVVDGNAYIIGKNVTITGEIGGDLFVIAEKLNIDGGYIYSGVFALANEITINGGVYDVYAICNKFNLGTYGSVYRDMRITASDISLNGKIKRNVFASCNSLNLSQDIGTIIYGNLNYSSNSEFSIEEGLVAGEVNFSKTDSLSEKAKVSVGTIIKNHVLDLLKTLLFTFVVVLVLIWLTPKFIDRINNMDTKKSFIALGVGVASLLAVVVIAIVGIFLIISVIGIPLVIASIFAIIAIYSLGNTIASIFFGKLFAKLLKAEGNVKFVLLTLASSLVIWLINLIPFIGALLGFLIWAFGVGTLLINLFCKKEKVKNK